MKPEGQYRSYLVRLWQDELERDGAGTPRWQGEVVDIQTSQSWQIDDIEPLLHMLKDLTTQKEG